MSSIPRKSVTGLPLKKYVLDTLNGLIDYLQTHRIQAGKGIDVRETASGYVIGLAQPPSNPPQVERGGGGETQDISNTIGNNPSIGITGSTSAVEFVGTGDVTITGNTNGQIEINATGGGIPFSGISTTSIRLDTGSHVYTKNGWAIMSCEISSYGSGSGTVCRAYLRVIQSNVTTDHLVISHGIDDIECTIGGSLIIPVVSGSTVQAYIENDSYFSIAYSLLPNQILIYE